jgi:hypothetical protein
MIFQRESFMEFIAEGEALGERQYQELSWHQDMIPYAVDRQAYVKLDLAGQLAVCTARRLDELIGYAIWYVSNPPEYSTTRHGINNQIYVVPEHRSGVGLRLLQFSERTLHEMGVAVMVLNVKKILDWGNVAEALGYEAIDTVYGKLIGGGHG